MIKSLLQAKQNNKLSPGKTTILKRIVVFLCVLAVSTSSTITLAGAPGIILTASWYSVESLKQEGTWRYSKGVMANGEQFNDKKFTCATRLYPLGTKLKIISLVNGNAIFVKVTDRISKRFAQTRIDLSARAFGLLTNNQWTLGTIPVKVEVISE